MSWDSLKQIAQALWESLMSLFSWNAYEKWKAVWELWLVTTWIWLTAVVWRKAFKVWMKEIVKHTAKKEALMNTPEIKWIISETNKKIENILPKKEVDFNKMPVEDIAKLWEKERLEAGSFFLQRKLTPEQEKAIIKAYEVWFPNKDWKFDIWDLRKKYIILEKAWFNDNEIRTLMEKWVCGKEKLPSLNSLYSHPKYSFLEKYKEVLWENLSLDDIVWEWTQAIIMKHPTNEKLVVKIAKPWEVDDIMKEFHNHNLFYEKWKNWIKNWLIDDTIKVPKVQKWEKDGYFFIEKVDWQSLYSKTLIDRFSHKLSIEDLEQIWKLDDKQVREFLKKKLNETDSYLDQIIEDYSLDNLMELLGNTYKIRKETWKIWWTPLDNAIKALRESGIAHNDLHPWNIMIDSTWNIYMIDFGRIKEFSK